MPSIPHPLFRLVFLLLACATTATLWASAPRPAVLPISTTNVHPAAVSDTVMAAIHRRVETPYKYGVILRGESGERVDGPKIFREDGSWYMIYTTFLEPVGYETCLARSDDLLHWEKLGRILPFRREGWDAWQAHGAPALVDYRWEGNQGFGTHEGRHWMTYVGGARQGYETDPLSIGLAWSTDPTKAEPWTRAPEPLLTAAQSDAREFENTTLYTSTVIAVDPSLLGYPFVMFYNGKHKPGGHEAIGMAVSRDLQTWQRYGEGPVVDNLGDVSWSISGNPQIVRIDDVWVMFYFGAFWQPGAFDTFACSYDLVNWTKWVGPHLVKPSEPYDRQFAHKPWVLQHEDVVYHFYCAAGDEGRVIALATSRDLRAVGE